MKPAQGLKCFSWPGQHCVSLIIAGWDGEDHNETCLALKCMMDRPRREGGEREIKSILKHNFLNKHLHSLDIVGNGPFRKLSPLGEFNTRHW